MLEESVESFINQWRDYALNVTFYARAEGSPLLECKTKSAILQVFERTNPYAAPTGEGRAIIHALAENFAVLEEAKKSLTVTGVSKIDVTGLVLEQRPCYLVVDAGIPLVVGLVNAKRHRHDESDTIPPLIGQWIEFSNQAPLHGFVLSDYQQNNPLHLLNDYDEI